MLFIVTISDDLARRQKKTAARPRSYPQRLPLHSTPPPSSTLIPRIGAKTKAKNTFANFVIPLAGLLTAVSTRLYDMGASTKKPHAQGHVGVAERVLNMCSSSPRQRNDEDSEEAPLLRKEASSSEHSSYSTSDSWKAKSQKAKLRWFVQSTMGVVGVLLVTMIIVTASLFFTGMNISIPLKHHYIAFIQLYNSRMPSILPSCSTIPR